MFALALEAVAVAEAAIMNDKVPHHVFRFVERELYDYPINRELVMDFLRRRDEILRKGRQLSDLDVIPDGGEMGDPTYASTVQLLVLERPAQRAMTYVAAIESVLKTLTEEQRKFVRRKYWEGDCTDEALAVELGVSRSTLHRMRRVVIRKFALRFGLV